MLRSLLSKCSAMALLAGLSLSGCPDPEGSMKDFVGRLPPSEPPPDLPSLPQNPDGGGGGDGGLGDGTVAEIPIDGQYLFAFSTFLRKDYPILFLAKISVEPKVPRVADVAGVMTLILQPLYCKNEGGAEPNCTREIEGDPLRPFIFDIGQDGRFEAPLGVVTVPGGANPVSGRDIVADLTLHGVRLPKRICGGVTGDVSAPITAPLLEQDNQFGTVWLGELGTDVDYKRPVPTWGCGAQ